MRLYQDQSVIGLGLVLVLSCLLGCQAQEAEVGEEGAPSEVETLPSGEDYRASIDEWRKMRDERLRANNGWLTLVGLFWLSEGESTFGSDASNALVFPASAPPRAGVFRLADRTVTIEVEPGVTITHDGAPVMQMELVSDADVHPVSLKLGTLTFHVIERGKDEIGIRVKDSESPVLRDFTGVEGFPIDERYRIRARFEPYDPPRTISLPTPYGTMVDETCGGAVVFEFDGVDCRIDAIAEAQGLFLIFGDRTNGVSSYGGGRYLYTDARNRDGFVIVDFNMAYNPPCVFTPFATCPLSPLQNQLPVAIEAGERGFGAKH